MRKHRCGGARPVLAALLAVGLTAAACGGGGASDEGTPKGPVHVTFALSWSPNANSMAYYVALAKGFYKDEGLDVELVPSQDPSTVIPLVGAGEVNLGGTRSPDVMLAVQEGVPVVGVWSQYQSSPFGIVSTVDGANILTAQDVVGKKIGLTSFPIDQLSFDLFLESAGLTRDQVEVVDAGETGSTLVLEGKLDGASALAFSEVVDLVVAGEDVVFLKYADYGGADFPFIVVIANAEWAKQNPDVVKAFIRASVKGYEYAKQHPDEAVDILLAAVPDLDRATMEAQWKEVIPYSESDVTKEHGIGYFDLAKLQRVEEFLLEQGLLKQPVDVNKVFLNDYQA